MKKTSYFFDIIYKQLSFNRKCFDYHYQVFWVHGYHIYNELKLLIQFL